MAALAAPAVQLAAGTFVVTTGAGQVVVVDFLVKTVMDNPGQVTILAIGPLTNIAMAMRTDGNFAKNVKQLVIMGGAIASLPDGGGNHTPNAEFNFYVDPEAAQVVLRSVIPIVLSPLNVSRKAKFTKETMNFVPCHRVRRRVCS